MRVFILGAFDHDPSLLQRTAHPCESLRVPKRKSPAKKRKEACPAAKRTREYRLCTTSMSFVAATAACGREFTVTLLWLLRHHDVRFPKLLPHGYVDNNVSRLLRHCLGGEGPYFLRDSEFHSGSVRVGHAFVAATLADIDSAAALWSHDRFTFRNLETCSKINL